MNIRDALLEAAMPISRRDAETLLGNAPRPRLASRPLQAGPNN